MGPETVASILPTFLIHVCCGDSLSEPTSLLLADGKSELRTDHFMVAVGLSTSQIPGFKSQFVFERYGLDHDTSQCLFLCLESGICKDQS